MARGSRVLGVVLLGCVVGTPAAGEPEVPSVLPTNGQVVLPDLSDPGLDGAITIRLGHRLRPWQRRLARGNENTFNQVGSAVVLLSHDFGRAAGDPDYDRRVMTLTLRPTLPLPPAQYTLSVDGRLLVRGRKENRLDGAVQVFRTSFTVGKDTYSPRVRETIPAPNQMDTPLSTPVTVVLNESLDPSTVVLNRTVLVEDAGADPPLAVAGSLTLEGDGFVMRFTPDPCAGLPPATRIRVRLLGEGNPEAVRDRVGNALEANYEFEFTTKGDRPLPDPRLVPPPAQALYATTADSVVAFDLRGAVAEDGSFHPEAIRQVLAGEGYGGDWIAHLGRPGDTVVDPQSLAETGHSYLYVVEEKSNEVGVIDSGTGKVLTRIGGFQEPRGLGALGPSAALPAGMLFISDHSRHDVTCIERNTAQGTPACAAWRADTSTTPPVRYAIPTGEGPVGVAATDSPALGHFAFVAANGGPEDPWGSVGLIAGWWRSFAMMGRVSEGVVAPIEVAWMRRNPGDLDAWILGSPGEDYPTGSISVVRVFYGYWGLSPEVAAHAADSIDNPGRPAVIPGSGNCLVPNSGNGTVAEFAEDGSVPTGIRLVAVRSVGLSPTAVATDPTGRLAFVSLEGEGAIAVLDLADPEAPPYKIALPGVRSVFTVMTQ